ncbi:MAG: hypothetical protein QXZ41_00330 [Ignisphaera sp.]
MDKSKLFRYGLSELLAITIGIAITIAIGVMLYMFIPNFMSTTTQQQKISLMILSANAIDNRNASISIAIRNLGTKAIDKINISIIGTNLNTIKLLVPSNYGALSNNVITLDLSSLPLIPGQEIPVVFIISGNPIISGTKVSILVTAKFVDGSLTAVSSSTIIM